MSAGFDMFAMVTSAAMPGKLARHCARDHGLISAL
jgi:hypothetical protein